MRLGIQSGIGTRGSTLRGLLMTVGFSLGSSGYGRASKQQSAVAYLA